MLLLVLNSVPLAKESLILTTATILIDHAELLQST